MQVYPYQTGVVRIAPVFLFIVRKAWRQWLIASLPLVTLAWIFLGIRGAFGASLILVFLISGLLAGIWWAHVRNSPRIELSSDGITLSSRLTRKHIQWSEVSGVERGRSFIWDRLITVYAPHTSITVNLPLIAGEAELIAAVRGYLPAHFAEKL